MKSENRRRKNRARRGRESGTDERRVTGRTARLRKRNEKLTAGKKKRGPGKKSSSEGKEKAERASVDRGAKEKTRVWSGEQTKNKKIDGKKNCRLQFLGQS